MIWNQKANLFWEHTHTHTHIYIYIIGRSCKAYKIIVYILHILDITAKTSNYKLQCSLMITKLPVKISFPQGGIKRMLPIKFWWNGWNGNLYLECFVIRVPMKLKGWFYNIYDQKVEKQSVKNRMQLKWDVTMDKWNHGTCQDKMRKSYVRLFIHVHWCVQLWEWLDTSWRHQKKGKKKKRMSPKVVRTDIAPHELIGWMAENIWQSSPQ